MTDNGNGKAPIDDDIALKLEQAAVADMMKQTIKAISKTFTAEELADAALSLFITLHSMQAMMAGKQLGRNVDTAARLVGDFKALLSSITQDRKKMPQKSIIIA